MKKKNAFTLVEILIVFTIVILLALMMVSIFASKNFFDKGKDSQRKKDLARIKVAFEEYYNDNNCYPQEVANWNIQKNCKSSSTFSPYLSPWPCDPNGEPYLIIVDSCNKFRVITNLENRNDEDIPEGWYKKENLYFLGKTINDVNYGVSSSNINWYEENYVSPNCSKEGCFRFKEGDICSDVQKCSFEAGETNCYQGSPPGCDPACRVPCCGPGCIYN